MPTKTFIRGTALYEAPAKRLQDDIEVTGATITRSGGRITAITFSGIDFSELPSYGTNAAASTGLGIGQLYKSTTLVSGSPIILITQ